MHLQKLKLEKYWLNFITIVHNIPNGFGTNRDNYTKQARSYMYQQIFQCEQVQ